MSLFNQDISLCHFTNDNVPQQKNGKKPNKTSNYALIQVCVIIVVMMFLPLVTATEEKKSSDEFDKMVKMLEFIQKIQAKPEPSIYIVFADMLYCFITKLFVVALMCVITLYAIVFARCFNDWNIKLHAIVDSWNTRAQRTYRWTIVAGATSFGFAVLSSLVGMACAFNNSRGATIPVRVAAQAFGRGNSHSWRNVAVGGFSLMAIGSWFLYQTVPKTVKEAIYAFSHLEDARTFVDYAWKTATAWVGIPTCLVGCQCETCRFRDSILGVAADHDIIIGVDRACPFCVRLHPTIDEARTCVNSQRVLPNAVRGDIICSICGRQHRMTTEYITCYNDYLDRLEADKPDTWRRYVNKAKGLFNIKVKPQVNIIKFNEIIDEIRNDGVLTDAKYDKSRLPPFHLKCCEDYAKHINVIQVTDCLSQTMVDVHPLDIFHFRSASKQTYCCYRKDAAAFSVMFDGIEFTQSRVKPYSLDNPVPRWRVAFSDCHDACIMCGVDHLVGNYSYPCARYSHNRFGADCLKCGKQHLNVAQQVCCEFYAFYADRSFEKKLCYDITGVIAKPVMFSKASYVTDDDPEDDFEEFEETPKGKERNLVAPLVNGEGSSSSSSIKEKEKEKEPQKGSETFLETMRELGVIAETKEVEKPVSTGRVCSSNILSQKSDQGNEATEKKLKSSPSFFSNLFPSKNTVDKTVKVEGVKAPLIDEKAEVKIEESSSSSSSSVETKPFIEPEVDTGEPTDEDLVKAGKRRVRIEGQSSSAALLAIKQWAVVGLFMTTSLVIGAYNYVKSPNIVRARATMNPWSWFNPLWWWRCRNTDHYNADGSIIIPRDEHNQVQYVAPTRYQRLKSSIFTFYAENQEIIDRTYVIAMSTAIAVGVYIYTKKMNIPVMETTLPTTPRFTYESNTKQFAMFNIYDFDTNDAVIVDDKPIAMNTRAFYTYLQSLIPAKGADLSWSRLVLKTQTGKTVTIVPHGKSHRRVVHESKLQRRFAREDAHAPPPKKVEEKFCKVCGKEKHKDLCDFYIDNHDYAALKAHSIPVASLNPVQIQAQSMLGAQTRVVIDEYSTRMFKAFDESGNFVNNAVLVNGKAVTTSHGFLNGELIRLSNLIGASYVLEKYDFRPDNRDLIISVMPKHASGKRAKIRVPSALQKVFLFAFDSEKDNSVRISAGSMNAQGWHTCPATRGNCSGILVDEEGYIIGFHQGGSSDVNLAIPVDANLVKILNEGF